MQVGTGLQQGQGSERVCECECVSGCVGACLGLYFRDKSESRVTRNRMCGSAEGGEGAHAHVTLVLGFLNNPLLNI